MAVKSAGILLYRFKDGKLQVMLVHPGGPFWKNKDKGAWSIPKGICEEGEATIDAAKREFKEETGFEVDGNFIDLGEIKQPSGKIVHVWAVEGDLDTSKLRSNTFKLEWPKGSGRIREYPEVDKGEWFDIDTAMEKITKGQRGFLQILLQKIRGNLRAS
ncbi:MAG: NUDIX hydrolase [Deltaproteobacteria bacterium]|nr:MAG: NUDIX hydrolase [Deltaproteobacteria bacterium]